MPSSRELGRRRRSLETDTLLDSVPSLAAPTHRKSCREGTTAMAKNATTTTHRARRSTKISQQLEAARRRNAEQLAEQRRREQEVDAALAEYVEAGEDIASAEQTAESKIDTLQRKIDSVRDDLRASTTTAHERQAQAALRIHQAGGRTVEQVSELLEMDSVKETRRILAAARTGSEPVEERSGVQTGPEQTEKWHQLGTSNGQQHELRRTSSEPSSSSQLDDQLP